MFNRLIARDEDLLGTFTEIARRAAAIARLLRDVLAEDASRDERLGAIRAAEHEADKLMQDLIGRIDRVLVTPIDRDDIHAVASGLDNVVDLIDGTARRTVTFRVRASSNAAARADAVRLADLLVRATAALESEAGHVHDRKRIFDLRRQVKLIEEEADAAYFEAVTRLFEGGPDPLEVIRWQAIFELLEQSIDACDRASGELARVALKHS